MRHHITKIRTGQQWDTAEEERLRQEVGSGLTVRAISSLHQRTKGSILKRMVKLQLIRPDIVYQPVTLEVEAEPVNQARLICVVDTETTGLPPFPVPPVTNSKAWEGVRMIQCAMNLYDMDGVIVDRICTYIKPDGFVIPEEAIKIHHITNELAHTGITIQDWFLRLSTVLPRIHTLIAHNMIFDNNVVQSELIRYDQNELLSQWKKIHKECTMMIGEKYVQDQPPTDVKIKLGLVSLCKQLAIPIPTEDKLHSADVDTELCAQLYHRFRSMGITNKRTDLHSMFQDKDVLKVLGARWDGGQRVWYIYDNKPFSSYVKKWFTTNGIQFSV